MNLEIQTKIFKLRSILNRISDISYAYKIIYNKYRLPDIKTNEQAKELIKAYEDLIAQVKSLIQNTENGQSKQPTT